MNLNLARKWRSKTFDQMVGQELPMSMLKNSLYSNYFMPVYLFSGQRGCGKTSAARLFAAAINCRTLPRFQENPKQQVLPCNQCDSCIAMKEGVHPDFIEIDAASNTGVDNIRTVIESATLLPTLSIKRIYLIDEVHMLSKAAFNAFLKILEEPPMTSLFILATTDLHKVLETVRSRSFQLFFKPIAIPALTDHLAYICAQESIVYEREALEKIALYADGSVRDALNLLEQMRFAYHAVPLARVHELLGIVPDQEIGTLLLHALNHDIEKLRLHCVQLVLERYDAARLWQTICQLLRDMLFFMGSGSPVAVRHELVATLSRITTQHDMMHIFDMACAHEHLFLQTTKPHHIIELLLCKIAMRGSVVDSAPPQRTVPQPAPALSSESMQANVRVKAPEAAPVQPAQQRAVSADGPWADFLQKITALEIPLLYSVFSQATYETYDTQAHVIRVSFSQNYSFFQDMLTSTQKTWQPLLYQTYGQTVTLLFSFDKQQAAPAVTNVSVPRTDQTAVRTPAPGVEKPKPAYANTIKGGQRMSNIKQEQVYRSIDVSDAAKWPKAQLVLSVFPGTIVESSGESHA
ncbi:MAG: DNA polymerase III subunit gamma/tau [Candidatus Babeliales bacterium]